MYMYQAHVHVQPVMGDEHNGEGTMYIARGPPSCLQREGSASSRHHHLPNQFEAELLTRRKIHSQDEVLEVMDKLYSMGPNTVVITSSYLLSLRGTDYLPVLGSQRTWTPDGLHSDSAHPQGDAQGGHHLSALGMASPPYSSWMHKHPNNLKVACEKTLSATHHVLQRDLPP